MGRSRCCHLSWVVFDKSDRWWMLSRILSSVYNEFSSDTHAAKYQTFGAERGTLAGVIFPLEGS